VIYRFVRFCWGVLGLTALLLVPARAQVTVQTDSTEAKPDRLDVRLLGQPLDTLLRKRPPAVDTAYIQEYYSALHLQLLSDNRHQSLHVRSADGLLRYRPNMPTTAGIGLGYGWLGLDLLFRVPFLNQDEARKGRTRQLRANVNVNTRKLWLGLQYQRYRGLYLANPDPVDWAPGEPYPQRPDLRSRTLSFQGYYCFNHRQFSNPATYFQRERQKRSAGSPLLGVTYYQHALRADAPLAPDGTDAPTGRRWYRTSSLGLHLGYVQTFVIREVWFLTGSLRPGLAIQSANRTEARQTRQTVPVRWGTQGDARVVAGYSSDRFYGGVAYSLELFSGRLDDRAQLRTTYGHLRLLAGTRLNPPGRAKSRRR
jgi:hypothetical protein